MVEKLSDRPAVVIAAVLIAVILVGEVIVYTSDSSDFSADASLENDTLTYSISADGSKQYSVIINENGSYSGIEHLLLYYDTTYPTNYADVDVSIGAHVLDQEYYLKQVVNLLESRGFHDIEYVDADQLSERLANDVLNGTSGKTGILVISGALPDTVYTGKESDIVFDWLSDGGSFYWLGNLLGSCYATEDGLHEVPNYQSLFFGAECLNTGTADAAFDEVDGNGYTHALSLKNNSVKYAVNPDLVQGRDCLAIGFTEDGYASIAMVEFGSGMICVLGGDYSTYQYNDLVQIITSDLGPQSRIVAMESGTVTNGNVTGTIDRISGSNLSAFIYLGGYYPVYSKLIWL